MAGPLYAGVVNATESCWSEGVIAVMVETGGTVDGVEETAVEYTEVPIAFPALIRTLYDVELDKPVINKGEVVPFAETSAPPLSEYK